jgi:hypothetical protein
VRLPPDCTHVVVTDYDHEYSVRTWSIVKHIVSVAARAHEDLNEFDRAQLHGMLHFWRGDWPRISAAQFRRRDPVDISGR